jgi:molybdopterin converting factor small subunit
MVKVKVKFFGVVRGLTDGPSTVVEMDDDATLADLLKELHKKYGKAFYDGVLCESNGLKGHVKVFLNDEEIDNRRLAATKVVVAGAAAEAMLYVVPSTAGG